MIITRTTTTPTTATAMMIVMEMPEAGGEATSVVVGKGKDIELVGLISELERVSLVARIEVVVRTGEGPEKERMGSLVARGVGEGEKERMVSLVASTEVVVGAGERPEEEGVASSVAREMVGEGERPEKDRVASLVVKEGSMEVIVGAGELESEGRGTDDVSWKPSEGKLDVGLKGGDIEEVNGISKLMLDVSSLMGMRDDEMELREGVEVKEGVKEGVLVTDRGDITGGLGRVVI